MTPEEFKQKMMEYSEEGAEEGHYDMDSLMCDVLEQLGYQEGVEIFRNTLKWYA